MAYNPRQVCWASSVSTQVSFGDGHGEAWVMSVLRRLTKRTVYSKLSLNIYIYVEGLSQSNQTKPSQKQACRRHLKEKRKWRQRVLFLPFCFALFLRLNHWPGSLSFISISCKEVTSSSWGAWITITVDPNMLNMHPIFPWMFKCSFKK